MQCCPISAVCFQLPFYTCYSTFDFILPGTERALSSDASIKASFNHVGIGPNSQPIALVFTTPELFLFIIGINEYWIKHGVVVCLTSNVLAQCPLCLTHTLSSYLWKKTKDWHFFFPINPGSEMGCDSSPSESQESFHGQQSNVTMTVGQFNPGNLCREIRLLFSPRMSELREGICRRNGEWTELNQRENRRKWGLQGLTLSQGISWDYS